MFKTHTYTHTHTHSYTHTHVYKHVHVHTHMYSTHTHMHTHTYTHTRPQTRSRTRTHLRSYLIGISGSLIWSKTLMELIFNRCGEFRWSPEGPINQIHSLHLHAGAPGIFSDLLRSVQMLKREWGVESNGKLPHLSIPSKTVAWVLELGRRLPLSSTAILVPEFAVKDLPLGRKLMINVENYKTRFPISSGAPYASYSLFTSVHHFLQMLVHYLVFLSY